MKNFIKQIADLAALVVCAPLLLSFRLMSSIASDRKAFRPYSELLSLLPGLWGQYIRRSFYQHTLESCSTDCYIGFGTLLSTTKTSIASGVYVGSQCSLGSVSLGKDTLVSSGVRVISGLQQHGIDKLDTPIKDQPGVFSTIIIGEDCWIGEGALIAADIGRQCIVAAGSVVIDDVPDFSIVAGNPARVIRSRNDTAKPSVKQS